GKAFAQGLYDRDSAADRRLEVERDVMLLGQRSELDATLGEQCLVRRYHRFAGGKRRLDCACRRIAGAANQFDKDVDARLARERDRVGEPLHTFEVDAAILALRTRADGDDLDGTPATRGEHLALARHLGNQGGADRAQSGDAHSQSFDHWSQRRVASGTTLCNWFGAVSRKRRMLRAAWRIRCSFSTSAMRTKPSPRSPKPVPGETATSAFSTSSFENSTLPMSRNGSGIGDQANIDAVGGGTSQPARLKLSTITSRRLV